MAIHKIKIFTGRDSEYLAKKIAASFGTTLGQSEVLRFSDGEFQPCYNESIRGCTVFIIQSTFPPSDNLMELLMMIDAARRASAYQVVAVMPYFGWARQDRKDRPRVPIGAKLVANMLMAAGVDRVMTMDLHADQIQGFFDVPVDALYASGIFVPYIKSLNIEDLSIAAPDMGGAKRANTYSKLLGTPIIISHKERAKANVVGKMTAIGDVEGRNVLIVDDMIDTAGTICMAADMLMSRGAKSVRAAITHPVLSGPAYERINESALEEVIVTDTIPLNPNKDLHRPVGRRPLRRRHRARAQLQGNLVDLLQIGEPASTQKIPRNLSAKVPGNFPFTEEGLPRLLSALGAAADILRRQATAPARPPKNGSRGKGAKRREPFVSSRPCHPTSGYLKGESGSRDITK